MLKDHSSYFFAGMAAFLLVAIPIGCGEQAGLYQEEELTVVTPGEINSQNAKEESELELAESGSDSFYGRPLGPAFSPFAYGLYDYYRHPVAYEVPIAPGYGLYDFVHPFYAYSYLTPIVGFHHGPGYFYDDDY